MAVLLKNNYYVLRHGESEANQEGLIVSDPAHGVPSYGLTAAGREQVARSVSEAGLPAATLRLVSSDFRRARESAEVAAALLGLAFPVPLEARLRERFFGEWDGSSTENYAKVWAHDPSGSHPAGSRVERVESVLERALAVVRSCEPGERGPSGHHVILVTHGDVAQILLAAFSGRGAASHRDVPHLGTGELRRLAGPGDCHPTV